MFSESKSQQQITMFFSIIFEKKNIAKWAFKIRNNKRNETCLDFLTRVTNWWDLRLRHDDYAICYTPLHTFCSSISQLWRLTRSRSILCIFLFRYVCVSAFVSFRKVICFCCFVSCEIEHFLIIIIKHSCQSFINSSERKKTKCNRNLITKHDDFKRAPIVVLFVVFHQHIFNSEQLVIYLFFYDIMSHYSNNKSLSVHNDECFVISLTYDSECWKFNSSRKQNNIAK